ncbi:MAG: glycosyltransferase, partial [Acidimicrobiales bacterium]
RIVEVPTVWLDRVGSHVHPVADGKKMAASALALWLHHRVIPLPDPLAEPDPVAASDPDPLAASDPDMTAGRRDRGRGATRRHGTRGTADVAMVTPFPATSGDAPVASGVTSHAARLAAALAAEGMTVEVIAPRLPGEAPRSRAGDVGVSRVYRPGPLAVPLALRAAMRTGAPVVHLQHETFLYGGPSSVPGLGVGLSALRHSGASSVVTLHQVVDPSDVDEEFVSLHRVRAPAPVVRAGLGAVQLAAEALADRVIVHEEAFVGLAPSAAVVPLGIQPRTPLPQAAARASLGLDPDRFVALCFGFLSPYKGLEAALEAAAIAGERLELVLAGGEHPRLAGRDPYAELLRSRFGDVARFTGYVADRDVAAWFSAADAVLVPYPKPFATSGAFADALSYGRPVLCSPAFAACVGAPAETVVPTDPRSLATQLLHLAGQPRALSRVASATERMARERTWERAARAHARIYEEVIDANRGPGGRRRTGPPR